MNTDTLELEPRTEVATAASTALDLERLDLTQLALARFGNWRGDVATVTANLGSLALDLSTAAKCKEARSLRQRLIGAPVADARKIAAGIKSKMAATSKAVGLELDIIELAYEEADGLILPKIEAREQELEAERQEKARIEAERVRVHKERLATIGAYLTACQAPGMTAARIERGIELLKQQTFGPEWEEFQVPAANAQCETLEAMRQLHAQVLGSEQEAARQEAIRLENERQAEANRIERKRIEDEAAEIRRQAQELAAAQEAQRREEAIKARIVAECAKARASGFKPFKPLPEGAVPGAVVNQSGQWYSASGLFMNEDGTRSIFCDVDEGGQDETPAPAPTPVTAAGFMSLGERFTDEDPDAATKLPGEPAEAMDAQEGVGLMEVAPAASAPEPATIKLGDLTAWAGFAMTRAFVESLGITPTVEGARVLFTASQKRSLKAALLRHVAALEVA